MFNVGDKVIFISEFSSVDYTLHEGCKGTIEIVDYKYLIIKINEINIVATVLQENADKIIKVISNRKIIQITNNNNKLTALCDDGTIWSHISGAKWSKINIQEILEK